MNDKPEILIKSIIQKMLQYPCGILLKEVIKCKIRDVPKTNPPQTKPLSFDLIHENINNKQYQNSEIWKYDILLYFSTQIEKYNRSDPVKIGRASCRERVSDPV